MSSSVNTFKPSVAKRYLMIIAAIVWLFAGGMLLFKGISFMVAHPAHILPKLIVSTTLGLLFFAILFSKIVAKHINRILNIKHERPCLFSFFNWKSYLLMGSMITFGIMLQTFQLVPMEYLSCFHVTMGIPLLISSHRFFKIFHYRP